MNRTQLFDIERGMYAEIYEDLPLHHKEEKTWFGEVDTILRFPVTSILIRGDDRSKYVKLNDIKRVWR